MNKNVIALYNRVSLPKGPSVSPTVGMKNRVATFNAELGYLGYTLGADMMSALAKKPVETFDAYRKETLAILSDLTGASRKHRILFAKFPYSTPDQHEYLFNRLIGYIQNELRIGSNNMTTLSCGHSIDLNIFNMEDFGACPICQNQVDEIEAEGETRHAYVKGTTPLKILNAETPRWLKTQAEKLLGANSSMSMQEREFVEYAAKNGKIKRPERVFAENLPFVYTLFNGDVGEYLKSATDVMRIAYYVSDKTSDLSLAANVKFKISTSHRKRLLNLLETRSVATLKEDFLRNRERWLRFGEHVHVSKKHPRVFEAMTVLRKNPESIPTFARKMEKGIRAKKVDMALIDLMATRPGEFMRKLDFMVRTASDSKLVVTKLSSVAKEVPTKLLLEIMKYFEYRLELTLNGEREQRLFLPKGQSNKVQVVEDTRTQIDPNVLQNVVSTIREELVSRFSKLEPMGRVYLDPSLSGLVLPYNRRGDSATTTNITKGSWYPMGKEPVIRMFIHWTGQDVDLSAMLMRENFSSMEHVSYMNLSSSKDFFHSGDITSAPNGATEFIDFNRKAMKSGYRYLVMSVISFSGVPFKNFECFAGYMGRDEIKSGAPFEPASVKFKMDVNISSRSSIPIIFDLVKNRVVFVDLATGGGRYGAVARHADKYMALTRAAVTLSLRKPTAMDVLALHVEARGIGVMKQKEADVVIQNVDDFNDFMKTYVDYE